MLFELTEYSNSVEALFLLRTLVSVAEISLNLPDAVKKCLDILMGLVNRRTDVFNQN
jgi:hypothetical protein